MKHKGKKKLHLEKIKIAQLDNLDQIRGGFDQSVLCPTSPLICGVSVSTKTIGVSDTAACDFDQTD